MRRVVAFFVGLMTCGFAVTNARDMLVDVGSPLA
jgi:hypothetical protein